MNELWEQRSRNDWQTEIEATRQVLHAPRTASDTVRLTARGKRFAELTATVKEE